jgi:hypothetical protein
MDRCNVDGGYSGSVILPNRMYGREGDDSMMLLGSGIIDVLEYEVYQVELQAIN